MDAIYGIAKTNPAGRFPVTLGEVISKLNSETFPGRNTSNLHRIFGEYVYRPPQGVSTDSVDFQKVVLIEKLGHYRYKQGGHIGVVGNLVSWYSMTDYKRLATLNGIELKTLESAASHPTTQP